MSPQQIKKIKQKRKKFVRKWHRRIGFTISIFLLNLAITGILLNHYESFGLHKKFLTSSLLLNWYGVKAPQRFSCSEKLNLLTNNRICQLDKNLISLSDSDDITQLSMRDSELLLITEIDGNLLLVSSSEIKLLQSDLVVIDEINLSEEYDYQVIDARLINDYLSLNVQSLVNVGTRKQIGFNLDDFELSGSESTINLTLDKSEEFKLSRVTDPHIQSQLSDYYRQHQIHLLKFVQDLHSGQILSTNGKFLMDFVAFLLILLALSGFITWKRNKGQRRK